MGKDIIVKYDHAGEHFEIIVDSEKAYAFLEGKQINPMSALEIEEIFKDANKGERQSADAIKKCFNTTDLSKIVEIMLKNGNVPLTTEQRNKMIEEKRKQIISIICKNGVDPRTNAPIPPQRVELIFNDLKIKIDPFKPATEQVEKIVEEISAKLPIKFTKVKIEIDIQAEYANRAYGILKQYGIKSEEWLSDGSLKAVVEIPGGMQNELFERLNNITHGNVVTKNLE